MALNDVCILNVALDYWYPKGQARMVKSMRDVAKFDGDILTWTTWPNNNFNRWPYNCKASAMEVAIAKGYKKLLWVDCSVYALRSIQPIVDIIDRQGYYFIDNGYNLAQTCSDACLDYFKVPRDNAQYMTEVATTIFGLNLNHQVCMDFARAFIQSTKDGAAEGSRDHDGQSADPRFKFHRQDQSVASVLFNQHGLAKRYRWGEHLEYFPDKVTNKTLMTMRGMGS